ncbi:MAG: D-serine ammonia-lyase [Comamonadaceae bacterium]|nr:MAG: D-serine ammonia-lyase [Comamonadaceae bacterium]
MQTHDSPAADDILSIARQRKPVFWLNPDYEASEDGSAQPHEPHKATLRLARQARAMQSLFPELRHTQGRVESALMRVPNLQHVQQSGIRMPGSVDAAAEGASATGTWWVKRDDELPVAGSIKARGGFHEVLALAESLLEKQAHATGQVIAAIDSPQARAVFSQYTVAVGSTGNLGLSIGLIAAALGFKSVVHMSQVAKAWKKDRLRSRGISVVEHAGDYAAAVEAGRRAAALDPSIHFVDDEQSRLLFLGYAAAARELQQQLMANGVVVDAAHPLFVYIPCGVGGAPGGIAYGLKRLFGANVHCFFAQPVASPSMLVQLASGSAAPVSVYDMGLDNRTDADGLAVAQASMLVAPLMKRMLSGVFTVEDDTLFSDIYRCNESEGFRVEPSAAAAFRGPLWLMQTASGRAYLQRHGITDGMAGSNHVLWSTGGSLVPDAEHDRFQARGRLLETAAQD